MALIPPEEGVVALPTRALPAALPDDDLSDAERQRLLAGGPPPDLLTPRPPGRVLSAEVTLAAIPPEAWEAGYHPAGNPVLRAADALALELLAEGGGDSRTRRSCRMHANESRTIGRSIC